MTGEFKEWADELATGLNFPENGVVDIINTQMQGGGSE